MPEPDDQTLFQADGGGQETPVAVRTLSDEDESTDAQGVAAVRCEDISGLAGTGKTYYVRQQIERDPSWGMLTAVTGIAAINLGATTVNSCLGYFDTASLHDKYLDGTLARRFAALSTEYRRLVIDERSMLDATQLDYMYQAADIANGWATTKTPIGITLVGDFAQLRPVKARYCFDADCWPHFADNTMRLTKVWRQDQAEFLQALEMIRRGDGESGAQMLSSVGVQWHSARDTEFDGTTILPTNSEVDAHNRICLFRVKGDRFTLTSRRWGRQAGEWGFKTQSKTWGIEPKQELKINSYVVIRANTKNEEGEFAYVNGDCGWIEGFDGETVGVRLARGGSVRVAKVIRSIEVKEKPDSGSWPLGEGYFPQEHSTPKRKYVLGQIEYFPISLAYATTVHRSQGLTLDRVQFDFRHQFAQEPGICYVAMSRCKTLEGLRLIGQRERFVKHCNADPQVCRWL